MSDFICFSLEHPEFPAISALDIAAVKPPYIHFRRQYHEFILYYILSGELFLTEGNCQYHLKENDFIILDPSKTHFGYQSSTCQFFYIHFSLPGLSETLLSKDTLQNLLQKGAPDSLFIKSAYSSTSKAYFLNTGAVSHSRMPSALYLPKYHRLSTSSCITQVQSLLVKALECFSRHELHHQLECSCLLLEILILLSKDFTHELLYDTALTASSLAQTVPVLLNFLHQSFPMTISSTLIESRYNCNFDSLNRQFKKLTGQTIFAYLNKLRIEKAKQLLSTGFYTVTDVASRTGFHDVYYFSKVFKKLTGMSPGKYNQSTSRSS